jgi:hypothetical protein
MNNRGTNTAYYIISTDDFYDEAGQMYWSSPSGWNSLEEATVYAESDIRSGVRLPIGGYWLRITPEGITRQQEAKT